LAGLYGLLFPVHFSLSDLVPGDERIFLGDEQLFFVYDELKANKKRT
jgi:hypothetical protein